MRRGALVLTMAAVFGAAALAPPAVAAPTVTLAPICNDPVVPYKYSISLSGFPPGSQVGVTSGGIGPAFFRVDSEGKLAVGSLGAFEPLGLVTVTAFEDLNENESRDPGEPLFSGSVDRPCEELVFGGTVTGSGDCCIEEFTTPFHFTIDARSGLGAREPSGTVTLDQRGVRATGRVTCVRVKGSVAAVGVEMANPPPGSSRGQLWLMTGNGLGGNFLSIEHVATAPTTCPPPSQGNDQYFNGEITIRQADPDVIPTDTTPPVLHLPDALTVNATSPQGARVNYRAFAIDTQDANPVLSCSPPKFSLFPIGTTIVRCTATDASGNEASGSLPLTVSGARDQLGALGTYIADNGLPGGLKAKVDAALAALGRGGSGSACGELQAFAQQVRAQAGKGLTPTQAGRLAFDADRIRAVLRCVPLPPPATVPTIRLAPACDLTQPDLGTPGPYGATLTLEAFPPNATIDLQLMVEGFGRLPLLATTDSEGRYGPISGSLTNPLGLVTATASLDGVVLATASIDNPCVLEPRGGR